jgi:hypothetical protein
MSNVKMKLQSYFKNSSMLMISVSDNFLVESDCFIHNKIGPFLAQGMCIYVGHSF